MEVEYVGRKIVEGIFSCRGQQIILPPLLSTAAGIRGHPNWLQEVIRDITVGRASKEIEQLLTKTS
jgi:all-trans-retinol dehydrogenase (NAD+)